MSSQHPEQPLAGILGRLDGARIPGGCEHCNSTKPSSRSQPAYGT